MQAQNKKTSQLTCKANQLTGSSMICPYISDYPVSKRELLSGIFISNFEHIQSNAQGIHESGVFVYNFKQVFPCQVTLYKLGINDVTEKFTKFTGKQL